MNYMTNRRLHAVCGASALAVMLGCAQAHAQSSTADNSDTQILDEIIVTATKRASTIQDVPFSINALTSKDIERLNANSIEDLSRNVAGLTIQNLGPGQSQVSIRGT